MNFAYLNTLISEKRKEFLDEGKPLFYIEITTTEAPFSEFDFILIKNLYTHTINIVQFHLDKWKCVLLEHKLMADPESDEEAEKYTVISKKQLIKNGFNEDAELIRIYLTQESTVWKDFNLKEIKLIKELSENSRDNNVINIKYSSNRFDILNKYSILNDKEEINEKLLEIMKVKTNSELNFTLLG